MSLYKYQNLVLLDYKSNWFLWEAAWRGFRPVTAIAWDGAKFFLDDRAYCTDPSDPLYGYGSVQMKQISDLLTQKYESKLEDAHGMKTPAVGPTEWFHDRLVAFTPCASKDIASWKRLAKGRHDTLRKAPRNKLTRRVL